MPSQLLRGSAAEATTHLTLAFNGTVPSNAIYSSYTAEFARVGEFALANSFAASYANETNAALTTRVLTNLGVTAATIGASSYATLASAVETAFAAYPAARGQVALNLVRLLTGLEGDATYGTAAVAWNNNAATAFTYSSNTANTASTTIAALNAPVARSLVLTTGVDTTLVGGAADDTYTASGTTLTSGDQLDGGAGTDTLNITTTAAASIGTGVTSRNVENVNVTATVGTATIDATNFAGVTTVGSNGSTADVVINNLAAIPAVNVTATSNNLTVGIAAAAVAGTADSATINLNGVATGATGNTISINGIETLNIASSGTASGSTTATVTIDAAASPNLTTVNLTGAAAAKVAVTLGGATSTVTGTVTSDGGAKDVAITADSTDKISVSMGAGNDTVRLGVAPGLATGSTTVGSWTVAGGAGTDTLVVGAAGVSSAGGSNISGFESVNITGGGSVTLSGTTNTISSVTFDASGGTLAGLAAGATVTQAAGGSATVSNATGWTGASDSLSVTVGSATTSGAITQSLAAALIESATITNLALSTDTTSARSVGVSGSSLRTLTVTGAQPTTITGGGAATVTVDASGVSGNVTLNAGTGGAFTVAAAGASITSAAGNDTITGGAGADTITSGGGNDNITAGAGNDVVTAGDGNDTINLGAGNDSVDGGAGNDVITAGTGADTMTGGDGADTFIIGGPNTAIDSFSTAAATDVITDFKSGTDKISVGQTNSSFVGNFATLQLGLANTTGDNQSFFVTSENQLYVIATKNTGYVATDTVVKLTGVTSITKEDLGFGSQGAGNSVTIAGGAGTVSTTARSDATIVSALTTDFDDSITLTVAGLTSGNAVKSSITGGAGVDTVNITTTAAGLTVLNDATSATGIALVGVEAVRIAVSDTLGGVVSLTNAIPTSVESITVTGANAGLTATFTAAGQTFNTTANTTLGGNASTITFANLKGLSASTGSANDVFNSVQADYTTISGGAGNDTVNISDVAALGTSTRLDGGTQATGGADILAFASLGASVGVDLDDLTTKGVITGFERIEFADSNDSAHAIKLVTGITQIATATSNANEKFNITGTAAQINALTSVVDAGATGETNLIISDAGTVSFSGDTTTAVDSISWQSAAVTLTLNNAAHVVSQGASTAGTAAQSVTFGDASAAQTATLRTTGSATFNVTAATLRGMNGADKGDMTLASAAGATTTLTVSGAGDTTAIDLTDADLVLTNANLDTISLGGITSAQTITYGAGTAATLLQSNTAGVLAGPVTNITESGSTQVTYTLNTDTGGASTHVLNVIGFDAGAGGDVLDLGGVGNTNGGGAATLSVNAGIAVAGASVTMTAAAATGGPATLYVLTGSTMRVNGNLAATGDAGVVEAAIINAALRATGSGGGAWVAGDEFYVVLDNGTDSGVYRVATAGTPNAGEVIDTAAEFSVTLVAVLQGVVASALVGPNFG